MSGSARLLLRGGRVIDPAAGLDGTADVLIDAGRIRAVAPAIPADGAGILDLAGCVVTPGLIDLHVHLREPGQTAKETIATGAAAAAAGGFTSVCAMPNTDPVLDDPERVRDLLARAAGVRGARVLPVAAATVGSRGREVTDIAALAAAGAVAVSDDGLPIATADLLAEALTRAAAAGIPVAEHCEDRERSDGGAVLAGPVARRLGVRGIPPEAESDAVARDLAVLARTGGRLHLCHLSTAGSVELLRRARAVGLAVTAEASPHHLTLTAEILPAVGSDAKMNPPLATDADREALVAALADGTIGCVATDHAPHTPEEKSRGLAEAPFGVVGLETAFGVLYSALVETGRLPLPVLVARLTLGPARAFALEGGTLSTGARADVAVFDPAREWTVEPAGFRSKGRNTPWSGQRLRGRAILTLVAGEVVHDDR